MADTKKQATPDTELETFYYPDANDGKGGTVRAIDKEAADKLAADNKFVNTSEAPATDAGEDKAE